MSSWFLTSFNSQWYPEIRHFSPHTPLVIMGTMTNLRPQHSSATGRSTALATAESHHTVNYDEGRKLAEELRASYVECSAKCDKKSVDHVLETVLWRWYKCEDQRKSRKGFGGCMLQ